MPPDCQQSATSATAEHSRAAGTPTRVARAPQAVLPTAMPPCNTSRYIDNARARKNDGHMVWAATFRQARIPIHAVPLANNTRHSQEKVWTRPAAKVMAAKSRMSSATTPSTLRRAAHARQNGRASQRAEPEESQQQAVSGRAVRTGQDRQQRGQGTRSQAEGPGPDQDRAHLRRAANIAQSRHHGIAHSSGGSMLDVRALPAVKKKITPKNEAALSRKATPEPAAAITSPPSAGPMARATLNPTEFRATAGA